MVSRIRPFLMFQDAKAGPALDLYLSLFPGGKVVEIARYGADGPGPEGSIKRAVFSLAGQEVMVIDSPSPHGFDFTPSFSFFVDCSNEAEIRRLTEALSEDGATYMPLGAYGYGRLFAWVGDRFGVSWQLTLP